MNKREFVLASGGALLGPSAWAATGAPAPATGASLAAWQQRVGERFAQTGGAALVLQRVDHHAGDGRSEQFTLVFAAAGPTAGAGTRVLSDADGQLLALYLDDAGQGADGQPLLRADCNQLV